MVLYTWETPCPSLREMGFILKSGARGLAVLRLPFPKARRPKLFSKSSLRTLWLVREIRGFQYSAGGLASQSRNPSRPPFVISAKWHNYKREENGGEKDFSRLSCGGRVKERGESGMMDEENSLQTCSGGMHSGW
jgi:hypothetical protein